MWCIDLFYEYVNCLNTPVDHMVELLSVLIFILDSDKSYTKQINKTYSSRKAVRNKLSLNILF